MDLARSEVTGHFYAQATLIPPAMAALLRAPSQPGRKATSAETVAFIEASTENTTMPVMQKFNAELQQFRGAGTGSRHDALVHIVGWSFGMEYLDLRWAMERIKAEWLALTAGEGREDEVGVVACWVVGRESTKRGEQAQADPGTDEVRFRRYSVSELLAEDRTFEWEIVGMLSKTTYGLDGGELKTLKSYFGLARDIGLAAGVSVLGHWRVPERKRVLVFVAEGGRKPYTNRLERMAAAHGVLPGSLDGWLEVIDDVAPLDSGVFYDGVESNLRDFGPAFVHLDPLYPFQPERVSSSQITEVGRMLTGAHRLCAEHGASFWVTAHMNQTGRGFDLKRISGAGPGEWADSWALLKHRSQPDVDAGRFRLQLNLGGRQWGGSSWDLDLNIGRFVPDLGLHDGPITYNVKPASSGQAPVSDPLGDVKLEVLRVGRKARRPLTRQSWLARVERKAELKRAAFDELVADGALAQVSGGKSPTFEVPAVQ